MAEGKWLYRAILSSGWNGDPVAAYPVVGESALTVLIVQDKSRSRVRKSDIGLYKKYSWSKSEALLTRVECAAVKVTAARVMLSEAETFAHATREDLREEMAKKEKDNGG